MEEVPTRGAEMWKWPGKHVIMDIKGLKSFEDEVCNAVT